MEQFLSEFVKAAPAQSGIIVIVFIFVRALTRVDRRRERFWHQMQETQSDMWKQLTNHQNKMFEEFHQEHVHQRELSRDAIQECNVVLRHSAQALEVLIKTVERCRIGSELNNQTKK